MERVPVLKDFCNTIRRRIRKWYDGELITYHYDPDFSRVYTNRHWSSRLTHMLVDFWFANWKWFLGFIVLVAGLIIRMSFF